MLATSQAPLGTTVTPVYAHDPCISAYGNCNCFGSRNLMNIFSLPTMIKLKMKLPEYLEEEEFVTCVGVARLLLKFLY